jgi:type IV secretion system protein VirB10
MSRLGGKGGFADGEDAPDELEIGHRDPAPAQPDPDGAEGHDRAPGEADVAGAPSMESLLGGSAPLWGEGGSEAGAAGPGRGPERGPVLGAAGPRASVASGESSGPGATAAASAAGGVSAVAGKSRIPWLQIGGLGALMLAGGWFLANALTGKPAPPPPKVTAAAAPAPKLPDLMEPQPVPVVKPGPAALGPPQRTRADELLEKSRQAPLMAAQTQEGAQAPEARGPARPNPAPAMPQSPLERSLTGSRILKVKAMQLGNPTLRLSAGSVIPCVLDTALDTTVTGFVRCHIPQDVYSANQSVVLLDAGTVILGEYQAGLKPGQERIAVVWTRAETPQSVTIDLSSPGTDALGRAGVDGAVETYFWTRFGAAIMFSLLSDAGATGRALAQNALTNNGGSNTYVYGNIGASTQGAAQQVGAETLRQTLAIPYVLRKNQGELVNIMVRNDLDFSDVYAVERR